MLKIIIGLIFISLSITNSYPNSDDCFKSREQRKNINRLRSNGDYEKVLKILDEVMDCYNNNEKIQPGMDYYYHLGWTYLEMKKYNKAIKAFNKGIPFQKGYPWVYLKRGKAFDAIGNKKNASNDLKKYLSLFDEKEKDFMKYIDEHEVTLKILQKYKLYEKAKNISQKLNK